MNRSKSSGRCRRLAMMATLFGAMLTAFLVPAYGQQEVDPTWYNPWVPPAAVVQSAPQPSVHHRHPRAVKPLSSQTAAKFRGKQSVARTKVS